MYGKCRGGEKERERDSYKQYLYIVYIYIYQKKRTKIGAFERIFRSFSAFCFSVPWAGLKTTDPKTAGSQAASPSSSSEYQ